MFIKITIKFEAKKSMIYLDIFKIYNFKKFTANRIEIIDSKLDLKTKRISNLYKTFTSLKKKLVLITFQLRFSKITLLLYF